MQLPLWLVVLGAVFAAIGLLDRIFAPSVRWFFQRKANTAIEELNTRLHLRIQPFKTTRRRALIDRLLYDPEVVAAIDLEAKETGTPREVIAKRAERYAREIVPAFNAYAYTAIGTRLCKWITTFVYRVRLGFSDDEALSQIDPEASVVFVMNHRSNMDYLIVTYLASASATLSYAVGEWARIWGLQNIIRAMGAYFIRRDSGNKLYRRVLARYVHMATREGVTQAMFPEGGLSRDGNLREPRFGLLSYMISGFDENTDRDVVFVPVGLNYDRVIEDRVLTGTAHRKIGEKTFRFGFLKTAAFVWNLFLLRVQGKLFRYGYACASFGKPVALKEWLRNEELSIADAKEEERFALVEQFGQHLHERVGDVLPVVPVALVASVFQDAGMEALSELELKARCFRLMEKLEEDGAHIYVPRQDRDYAISAGLRMLTLRRLVREEEGAFVAERREEKLLAYYANSIGHRLAA